LTSLDEKTDESAMQRLGSITQHADRQSPHQPRHHFGQRQESGAGHKGDTRLRIASTKAYKSVKRLHNNVECTMFDNKDSAVICVVKHM
tara:strand:- start:150 stop:416 length:267 start_codon:yes stop_codon:yes gene_type:complete